MPRKIKQVETQADYIQIPQSPQELQTKRQEVITAIRSGESHLLWEAIVLHQGHQFFTSKGLPLTYVIKGRELFCDRRERSITASTFERGYAKILEAPADHPITGPKKLGTYGAPYVWSILKGLGIL